MLERGPQPKPDHPALTNPDIRKALDFVGLEFEGYVTQEDYQGNQYPVLSPSQDTFQPPELQSRIPTEETQGDQYLKMLEEIRMLLGS